MTAFKAFEIARRNGAYVLSSISMNYWYTVGRRYEIGTPQLHLYGERIPITPYFFFDNSADPFGYTSWSFVVKIENHAPLVHHSKSSFEKQLMMPYEVSYLGDWFELPQGAECYCFQQASLLRKVAIDMGLKPIDETEAMKWRDMK